MLSRTIQQASQRPIEEMIDPIENLLRARRQSSSLMKSGQIHDFFRKLSSTKSTLKDHTMSSRAPSYRVNDLFRRLSSTAPATHDSTTINRGPSLEGLLNLSGQISPAGTRIPPPPVRIGGVELVPNSVLDAWHRAPSLRTARGISWDTVMDMGRPEGFAKLARALSNSNGRGMVDMSEFKPLPSFEFDVKVAAMEPPPNLPPNLSAKAMKPHVAGDMMMTREASIRWQQIQSESARDAKSPRESPPIASPDILKPRSSSELELGIEHPPSRKDIVKEHVEIVSGEPSEAAESVREETDDDDFEQSDNLNDSDNPDESSSISSSSTPAPASPMIRKRPRRRAAEAARRIPHRLRGKHKAALAPISAAAPSRRSKKKRAGDPPRRRTRPRLVSTMDQNLLGGPWPKAVELDTMVPIYTSKERAYVVRRYLEKKKRRKFKRVIRYQCRKRFADKRPRIGGRFVKLV